MLSRWPSQFRQELDKVYAAIRAGKVLQTGQNVMVYYPRTDGRVDIECGVEVGARFEPAGEVRYCETPGGLAMTTTHEGPYDRLGVSHRAVVDWSRQNGRRVTGIVWEIYGDWDDDTSKLRTEIFHLLGE